MRGYLLDTNIVAFWFDENRPEHQSVVSRIDALDPDTPLRVSAITLGEIHYGHQATSTVETPIQAEFSQFLRHQLPSVLGIRQTTSLYYGQLRARLFERFAPRKGRRRLRPEQLTDPVTAMELGIQENDVWIAAQAAERNLVLVTHDMMARIKNVADNLLHIEDWAK